MSIQTNNEFIMSKFNTKCAGLIFNVHYRKLDLSIIFKDVDGQFLLTEKLNETLV